jgi:hypothetical protein
MTVTLERYLAIIHGKTINTQIAMKWIGGIWAVTSLVTIISIISGTWQNSLSLSSGNYF